MHALGELEKGPPRASAIVGGALLDDWLRKAIEGRLMQGEPRTLKTMFRPEGELSGFEAKVRLAFMLGMFTEETRENLIAVNSIRNRFAHKIEVDSYDHADLQSFIDKLSIACRRHEKGDIFGGMSREPLAKGASNRDKVMFVLRRLLTYLALVNWQRTPPDYGKPAF
jgi:hypothetical protein